MRMGGRSRVIRCIARLLGVGVYIFKNMEKV